MKKSPLQQVRERFDSKEKLVEALLAEIRRPAEIGKEEMKKKLSNQSNRKLLILYEREEELKRKYTSREKLIEAIVHGRMGQKKAEDKAYHKQLGTLTTGQLLDLARRIRLGS